MVYVGVGGLVLTTAVGVFFWQPMDTIQTLQMGAMMVTSTVAHVLMMVALSRAPASSAAAVQLFRAATGAFCSATRCSGT